MTTDPNKLHAEASTEAAHELAVEAFRSFEAALAHNTSPDHNKAAETTYLNRLASIQNAHEAAASAIDVDQKRREVYAKSPEADPNYRGLPQAPESDEQFRAGSVRQKEMQPEYAD